MTGPRRWDARIQARIHTLMQLHAYGRIRTHMAKMGRREFWCRWAVRMVSGVEHAPPPPPSKISNRPKFRTSIISLIIVY